jgi:hypothetical protein
MAEMIRFKKRFETWREGATELIEIVPGIKSLVEAAAKNSGRYGGAAWDVDDLLVRPDAMIAELAAISFGRVTRPGSQDLELRPFGLRAYYGDNGHEGFRCNIGWEVEFAVDFGRHPRRGGEPGWLFEFIITERQEVLEKPLAAKAASLEWQRVA